MKLFIPEIGTRIQLTKDWRFPLIIEERNESLIKVFHGNHPLYLEWEKSDKISKQHWKEVLSGRPMINYNSNFYDESLRKWSNLSKELNGKEICIKKGSILEVDRIYIRQGNAEYSSVTFKIRDKKVLRFWAKLADVNNIEGNILEEKTEREPNNNLGGANYFHG